LFSWTEKTNTRLAARVCSELQIRQQLAAASSPLGRTGTGGRNRIFRGLFRRARATKSAPEQQVACNGPEKLSNLKAKSIGLFLYSSFSVVVLVFWRSSCTDSKPQRNWITRFAKARLKRRAICFFTRVIY
jgi:hypothetical protein